MFLKEIESIESTSTSKRLQCNDASSSQSLWHVMDMFPIPDVDIMEQIYNSATVRLASNDAESATTTFDTIPDDVTLDQLVRAHHPISDAGVPESS